MWFRLRIILVFYEQISYRMASVEVDFHESSWNFVVMEFLNNKSDCIMFYFFISARNSLILHFSSWEHFNEYSHDCAINIIPF